MNNLPSGETLSHLTYMSLFSSAGLGCYGFKQEQFECIATAELLSKRIEVQKANQVAKFSENYVQGDLTTTLIQNKIRKLYKKQITDKNKDLTVILATPPCQGISVANHKKKNELPRNSLVVESIKLVREFSPQFFIFENVRGFSKAACLDVDGIIKPIEDAITNNLSGKYNINFSVVNLKDYGSPSSRTRSIVIGVRKDIPHLTPYDIFPEKTDAPTLKALIGNLTPLENMGDICKDDIFHAFRKYDSRMLPWIVNTKEGQSAFENENPLHRPHRVINGELVPNVSKNSDKYKRNSWNKVAPCVHTRNDILASQSTVHPHDNRVFSIRELSLMMGVPKDFLWTPDTLDDLNNLPEIEKIKYLKENEINIRQCLGEGVPTPVIRSIASKIREHAPSAFLTKPGRPVSKTDSKIPKISDFINEQELSNTNRNKYSAFYTRQDTVFAILKEIPKFENKNLSILEPSVGAGAFLPQIFKNFEKSKSIAVTAIDIDEIQLEKSKSVVSDLDTKNSITYINGDFLSFDFPKKFDLVIGNPPFGKNVKSGKEFKSLLSVKDLYAKFLEKSLKLANWIGFVIPKTFLMGQEFTQLRSHVLRHNSIYSIIDFAETSFKGVKIETIGIVIGPKKDNNLVKVYDYKKQQLNYQLESYITDPALPYWVIYRNSFFDKVLDNMDTGYFKVYRDRSLTKKDYVDSGIPIIKSSDLGYNGIVNNLDSASRYSPEKVPRTFLSIVDSAKTIALAPNLSYYTRIANYPGDGYPDGSVAVLYNLDYKVDIQILNYFYQSKDFFFFYRIARNYSIRSLNIDNLSVFYWGVPRKTYKYLLDGPYERNSKYLYDRPVVSDDYQ